MNRNLSSLLDSFHFFPLILKKQTCETLYLLSSNLHKPRPLEKKQEAMDGRGFVSRVFKSVTPPETQSVCEDGEEAETQCLLHGQLTAQSSGQRRVWRNTTTSSTDRLTLCEFHSMLVLSSP